MDWKGYAAVGATFAAIVWAAAWVDSKRAEATEPGLASCQERLADSKAEADTLRSILAGGLQSTDKARCVAQACMEMLAECQPLEAANLNADKISEMCE